MKKKNSFDIRKLKVPLILTQMTPKGEGGVVGKMVKPFFQQPPLPEVG
jgi:hypothetical protein